MVEDIEQLERWGRTYYAMGHSRFIWQYGVGYFGVPFGVLISAAQYINLTHQRHPDPWIALFAFPLCLIGGYFFGLVVWRYSEAAYLKALKNAKSQLADRQAIEDLTQEVSDLRRELRQAKDDRIQR